MHITFDPDKDAANTAKHGVSLALAAFVDWDTAWIREDNRRDYGEVRYAALATHQGRLHHVAYTERDEQRRIISLRKANRREVDRYVTQTHLPHS